MEACGIQSIACNWIITAVSNLFGVNFLSHIITHNVMLNDILHLVISRRSRVTRFLVSQFFYHCHMYVHTIWFNTQPIAILYMFVSLWVIRLRQCGCGVKFMVVMIRSHGRRVTRLRDTYVRDVAMRTVCELHQTIVNRNTYNNLPGMCALAPYRWHTTQRNRRVRGN